MNTLLVKTNDLGSEKQGVFKVLCKLNIFSEEKEKTKKKDFFKVFITMLRLRGINWFVCVLSQTTPCYHHPLYLITIRYVTNLHNNGGNIITFKFVD